MSLVETLKTKLTVSVLYIVEICLGEMMLTVLCRSEYLCSMLNRAAWDTGLRKVRHCVFVSSSCAYNPSQKWPKTRTGKRGTEAVKYLKTCYL